MKDNIILSTDAYKLTHWKGYPDGLSKQYSYGEARKGARYPKVCFFGMQMIIMDHFLQPVTNEMIKEAEEVAFSTFGTTKYFNKEVWEKVRDLGYLPIRIKAIPEGTVVEQGNILFSLESTEPWFANTANALEDLCMHVWYPMTVATRIMNIKNNLIPFVKKSSEFPKETLPFMVNDFGYRGATGHEAAYRGGAAHLIHFEGSDNLAAKRAIKHYYNGDALKSVWASEHSTACAFGLTFENEKQYLLHQLNRSEQDLIVSIVIDSKNADNYMMNVVGDPECIETIKKRPGRVVFRPDSGIPLQSVSKYSDILVNHFGMRINNLGYRIIDNNVGLIQGDGMNENTIPELYDNYLKLGYSSDNLVVGSGGGLLQEGLSRDTERMAIKGSYIEINGVPKNIKKQVETDPSKESKTGMLKLTPQSFGNFSTISSATGDTFHNYVDVLQTVFENGELKNQTTLQEIRNRLKN